VIIVIDGLLGILAYNDCLLCSHVCCYKLNHDASLIFVPLRNYSLDSYFFLDLLITQ